MTETLLLRADASPEIGAGHVMRCLALAQGWRDRGGRAVLAGQAALPQVAARLAAEGVEVRPAGPEIGGRADADATARLAGELGADHVVADGYRFDAEFQERLVGDGRRLLVIDDHGHAAAYPADIVLNPGCDASEALYPRRGEATRLLLGPRFAPLRREFLRWRTWQRRIPPAAAHLLATAGGSDPTGLTARLVKALRALDGEVPEAVVVGGQAGRRPRAKTGKSDPNPIEHRPQTDDMAALMAWADLAVSAAGSTSWELAFMGVPALLIVVADNQRPVARGLAAREAAVDLGDQASLGDGDLVRALRDLAADPARREALSRRGRELVDGHGVGRALMQLAGDAVRLRPVEAGDRKRIWEWANDPTARALSFSPEPIPWDDHVRWFERMTAASAGPFWVAVDADDEPVGQVRFSAADPEGAEDRMEIHLAIAPGRRGGGLGRAMLGMAVRRLFATTGATAIDAAVRSENETSLRLFAGAGFTPAGEAEAAEIRGVSARRFVLERGAA